jgi:hypothetical protein
MESSIKIRAIARRLKSGAVEKKRIAEATVKTRELKILTQRSLKRKDRVWDITENDNVKRLSQNEIAIGGRLVRPIQTLPCTNLAAYRGVTSEPTGSESYCQIEQSDKLKDRD